MASQSHRRGYGISLDRLLPYNNPGFVLHRPLLSSSFHPLHPLSLPISFFVSLSISLLSLISVFFLSFIQFCFLISLAICITSLYFYAICLSSFFFCQFHMFLFSLSFSCHFRLFLSTWFIISLLNLMQPVHDIIPLCQIFSSFPLYN